MRYLYKSRFLKGFEAASSADQSLIRSAEHEVRQWHDTRKASAGLRIKLLHRTPTAAVYEARVSLALRLLWAEQHDLVAFLMVGSHDEVKRFLKSL